MEPTETELQQAPIAEPDLVLNQDAKYYLYESGKWARFLGIMGFIGSAFIALMGIFFGTLISVLSPYQQQTPMPAVFGPVMGIFYLLMAVFNFFIALYLYQFGVRIKKGIGFSDPLEVSNALGKLKSLFKISGITVIVILSIYALVIVALIIGAIIGASIMHH